MPAFFGSRADLMRSAAAIAAVAIVAATPVAGIAAAASINLTPDNSLVRTPAYLKTVSGSINKPAAGTAWMLGLFFETSENTVPNSQVAVIATSGSASGTGSADSLLSLGANAAADGSVTLTLRGRTAGADYMGTAANTMQIPRQKKFFTAWGITEAKTPFWVVASTDGLFFQAATFTAGSDTSAAQANIFSYFGAAGSLASGNSSGYPGRLQNLGFYTGGAIPLTAGTLNDQIVKAIAQGKSTLSAYAATLGMTAVLENPLNTSLASTVGGNLSMSGGAYSPTVTPVAGTTVVPCAWLQLDAQNDGCVWGVRPDQNSGVVSFSGSYGSANGAAPSLEFRLQRVDTGAALAGFDWQPLPFQTAANGTFSGTVGGVPGGIAFTRQVRFAGQPATAYAEVERHAVGHVIAFNAQSQTAHLFTPLATAGGGSGSNQVAITESVNSWTALCAQAAGAALVDNGTLPTNSPLGASWAIRRLTPKSVGWIGDGAVMIAEKIRSYSGWPVMLVNMTDSGQHPMAFFGDRHTIQIASQALTGANGSTTTLSGSINTTGLTIASELTGTPQPWDSGTNYGTVPMLISPYIIQGGTLQMMVAGILVTDTPVPGGNTGTLAGVGVAGTINYATLAYTLTFTTAPSSGSTITGNYTFISDYVIGQNVAKTVLNGFSKQGIPGQKQTGELSTAYLRLGPNTITALAHTWWTSWVGNLLSYSGGGKSVNNAAYTGVPRFFAGLIWDGLRKMHGAYGPAAYARVFLSPASREALAAAETVNSSLSYKFNLQRVATREYVRVKPNTRMLCENYDATIANNNGPHQTVSSYVQWAERLAISIASGLGLTAQTTEGPRLAAKPVLSADKTKITLTYVFPDTSATTLKTRSGGGVGSTLKGFDVGTSATSAIAAFTARVGDGDATNGFSAKIASATTVEITKASGTWSTFTTVSYMGMLISTGTDSAGSTTNAAADAITMGSLLTDDAGGKYTYPSGTPAANDLAPPAGNLARPFFDLLYNGTDWTEVDVA